MVDNNQIAMNAAVEISYLGSKEQAAVMQSIEKEETSPSIAQARKMRKFHQDGNLSNAIIDSNYIDEKTGVPVTAQWVKQNKRLNELMEIYNEKFCK